MPAFEDAFICYGRSDSKAFVIALKEQLKAKGLGNIWLDLYEFLPLPKQCQKCSQAIDDKKPLL
ncbi:MULTISPECIES: toll/interleukin-1 receptor domain-containing protein [Cyanophyceae]|uniref:toll/interleukin-1 receptor domain-containing protein n=1 Tax=Cyanophyceae TaxID=3028117 RepID=UPI001682627F|nr:MULTISPECIES: toll/interleukin-1 receptor domain-containing protein [Cyanophyceae]MBD1916412.1 toll/interleukin-1 receptor domain-containing protein [Phormidium sp. FACHB-77]MBD2032704.1 toll/interleukin-1 receptor domain-containing protein [Phormidium sp. FACHB-322]MBD2050076.1 toll/interleukin-1 receptor domain-containing protein [Leptolyngbya sp. FACHB-60]